MSDVREAIKPVDWAKEVIEEAGAPVTSDDHSIVVNFPPKIKRLKLATLSGLASTSLIPDGLRISNILPVRKNDGTIRFYIGLQRE